MCDAWQQLEKRLFTDTIPFIKPVQAKLGAWPGEVIEHSCVMQSVPTCCCSLQAD
jgi:hypothetical protein